MNAEQAEKMSSVLTLESTIFTAFLICGFAHCSPSKAPTGTTKDFLRLGQCFNLFLESQSQACLSWQLLIGNKPPRRKYPKATGIEATLKNSTSQVEFDSAKPGRWIAVRR
jgi:hypothetical protein